jgi:hypothetical protein
MHLLLKMLQDKWVEALLLVFWPSAIFLVLPGGDPTVIAIVVLGGLISIVVVVELHQRLSRKLRERRAPRIGEDAVFQTARRGVVFTLGLHSAKADSVARLVLTNLEPEFVGFLGTPETDKQGIAATLSDDFKLPSEKVKCETWDPIEVGEGKIKTGLVIDWMRRQGLDENSIVLDLTGGTVTMSIAAFMAAEERHIDSQYIGSEFDKVRNLVIPNSQKPILITRYTG